MTPRVLVVGDVLLDEDVDGRAERLCPDAPAPVLEVDGDCARPGGAGLAAVLLAADGPAVRLVAALDDDDAARRLQEMLAGCVEMVAGPATGGTAVKTRLRADGRVLLRADRGEGRAAPHFGVELGSRLTGSLASGFGGRRRGRAPGAVLVSDYGRGVAADPLVRAALADCAIPVVWDPHPRGDDPAPGTWPERWRPGCRCAARWARVWPRRRRSSPREARVRCGAPRPAGASPWPPTPAPGWADTHPAGLTPRGSPGCRRR